MMCEKRNSGNETRIKINGFQSNAEIWYLCLEAKTHHSKFKKQFFICQKLNLDFKMQKEHLSTLCYWILILIVIAATKSEINRRIKCKWKNCNSFQRNIIFNLYLSWVFAPSTCLFLIDFLVIEFFQQIFLATQIEIWNNTYHLKNLLQFTYLLFGHWNLTVQKLILLFDQLILFQQIFVVLKVFQQLNKWKTHFEME